jgi:integrase
LYPTKEKLAPVEHHAAMPYRQVPDFLRKLRQTDDVAARALEFAILTAARSAEVLQARWSEIDREGRTWVIPKGHIRCAGHTGNRSVKPLWRSWTHCHRPMAI